MMRGSSKEFVLLEILLERMRLKGWNSFLWMTIWNICETRNLVFMELNRRIIGDEEDWIDLFYRGRIFWRNCFSRVSKIIERIKFVFLFLKILDLNICA